MRNLKRLMAVLIAVCMLCGMPLAVSVQAADEYVTYTATQIACTDTTVTVQLKFSEPVWIRSGNVWLCNDPNPASCSNNNAKWQAPFVSSSPALTATFDGSYSDTYTLTYSRCTNSTHTNHYDAWKNGLPEDSIVRIVDLLSQYQGTAIDGIVDEFAFRSQSGKPLAAQRVTDGMEVAVADVEVMPRVVSAVVQDANNATGVELLVTFSKPVTRGSASGHVYLCDKYNPNPNNQVTVNGVTYTSWQKSPSSLTYINGTTGADGNTYSSQILFTFPSPGTPLPSTAGIRIVEYNAAASEKNTGEVWSDVMADENGIGLMPTVKDGSVDISFTTVAIAEAAQNIVSVIPAGKTQVRVNFAMMVKALQPTGMTMGGASVTAAERVGGDANGSGTWLLTLDRELTEADTLMTMPANTVTLAYNGATVTKVMTASTDPWVGFTETADTIPLENKPYHFMNTDTGRSLALKDGGVTVDEFTLVRRSADSNLIALQYGDQYIDLRESTVALSELPVYYLLKACANERYQLLVDPDYLVTDADTGTDALAAPALSVSTSMDISTGWYITASGDTRPLKLLPLGDSLTDGVDYDRAAGEPMVSYRAFLSQDLTEYFGRIVFVGPKRSVATTLDETRLLRHAGYSGYVVEQIWTENTYEETYQHPGVEPFIDDITTKYTPDIVCLMLGTNDLSQMNMNIKHTGKTQAQLVEEWLPVYEDFAKRIEDTLGVNGMILCASLTLRKGTNGTGDHKMLSDKIEALVGEMADEGVKTCFVDNYSATVAVGDSGINAKDSVHLNAKGYAAVAETWYGAITAQYGRDSLRKISLQELLNSSSGTAVLDRDYTVDTLNVPNNVTLDLNGHTLTAESIVAIGQIVDSREGEGGIKIAKNISGDNSLILTEDNAMLPLYDTAFGGYRFFTVTLGAMDKNGDTTDSCKFGVQFAVNDKAFALLQDAANADVTLQAKLHVSIDGEPTNEIAPFVFRAATLADYADKTLNTAGNWAITLTVRGFDSLKGDIDIRTVFTLCSSTGAAQSSSAVSRSVKGGLSVGDSIENW